MKKAGLLFVLVALAGSALAQKNEKGVRMAPEGTDVCQSTFTSGNGVSYMTFCTTQNGNVSKFESPYTFSQIYHGGEGYGLCDMTNGSVPYYDWGTYGDSGNWLAAVITQPNGPNTFPLTITRTTTDGVWTLKQVFSRNANTPSVKVAMTLKNNSGVTRQVLLERFADIDADGITSSRFDSDQYQVWGYHTAYGQPGHGLVMRTTSTVSSSNGGIVDAIAIDPCNWTWKVTPYEGDAAVFYGWPFLNGQPIGPGASKTAVLEYRAF